MAQAPSGTDVADWAGDDSVWFKVTSVSIDRLDLALINIAGLRNFRRH